VKPTLVSEQCGVIVIFDEELAARVRTLLSCYEVTEKAMFGGLTFLLRGNMCCGVVNGDLMVRLGPRRYEDALTRRHARPMDFTGRPISGFVFVSTEGVKTDRALAAWVKRGVDFTLTLPPKQGYTARKRTKLGSR